MTDQAITRRQAILETFRERLQVVRKVDGFQTDAGDHVFLGAAPELGEGDPDEAFAVVVLDDEVRYTGEHLAVLLPVGIAAVAKADCDEPWLAIEALLWDIKQAIETDDRSFSGLLAERFERGPTQTLPREPGSTTVGVMVTYRAPYNEVWGHPNR